MMKFKPFTDSQYQLLVQMKADGKSWTEIGEACGHSANSCSSTYCMRQRRAADRAAPATGHRYVKRDLRQKWPDADVERLLYKRDVEHKPFHVIDTELGRGVDCSRHKYQAIKAGASPRHGPPEEGNRIQISPAAAFDRDARYQARLLQSPAAALMGDPLPGRSALDQKRGQQA